MASYISELNQTFVDVGQIITDDIQANTATIGTGSVSNLLSTTFYATNATITSATVPTLVSTTGTFTNLFATTLTSTSSNIGNATCSSLCIGNASISTLATNTYTIPAIASSDFVMTLGDQTIGGLKTFSSTVTAPTVNATTGNFTYSTISAGSISSMVCTAAAIYTSTTNTAHVENMVCTASDFTEASVGTLWSNTADVTNGTISTLNSVTASLVGLTCTNANITSATIPTLSCTTLNIASVSFPTLVSTNATITNLTCSSINNATIDVINSASAQSINFGTNASSTISKTINIGGNNTYTAGQALMKFGGKAMLEFGVGITKENNAGKIGYTMFSNGLDIVGAGTGANRLIKMWEYVGIGTDPSTNNALTTTSVSCSSLVTSSDAAIAGNLTIANAAGGPYRSIRLSGGNSAGYIWGYFGSAFSEAVNISYNYYVNSSGVTTIPNNVGGTALISCGFPTGTQGDIRFAVNNNGAVPAEKMKLTSTGLRIGSGSNPNYALDVTGSASISDRIYANNANSVSYVNGQLQAISSSTANGDETQHFGVAVVSSSASNPYMTVMGTDTTNGAGFIQSFRYGINTAKTLINARGGNVGIGGTNAAYSLDVTGTVNTNTGILLPTSGGTATTLNYYEEYKSTITFSGAWASNLTRDLYIVRVGKMCTLHFVGGNQIANSSPTFISAAAIPNRFFPIVAAVGMCSVTNNGGFAAAYYNLGTSGSLSISIASGTFVSGTSVGPNGLSISYQCA